MSDVPTSRALTNSQVASTLAQAATVSPEFGDQMRAALAADGYVIPDPAAAPTGKPGTFHRD